MPLMCLVLSWFYPPLMLIRQSHAKSETLGKIWYVPKCASSLQSDTLRHPTVPNNLWERPSALLLTYWMIRPARRARRSLKGAGNELQISLSPGSFQETSRRILGLSHFSCKVNLQMVMLWNQAHSVFFDLCHQCLTHAFFFLCIHHATQGTGSQRINDLWKSSFCRQYWSLKTSRTLTEVVGTWNSGQLLVLPFCSFTKS